MSISRNVLRGPRTVLAVVIAVTGFGCRPWTYDPGIASWPLPPGVNTDPTQFRAQVAMRTLGPTNTRSRVGSMCAGCRVQVEIGPLGNTQEVNPRGELIPATGRAVAKIVNRDATYAADMYGFRPSSQFEYYVWADTAGSTARMTLLEVPAAGQPGVVRAIFQKNLMLCIGHAPPRKSDADFRRCEGVHLSTGLNVTHAGMSLMAPLVALVSRVNEFVAEKLIVLEPPIWLGCLSGCCG